MSPGTSPGPSPGCAASHAPSSGESSHWCPGAVLSNSLLQRTAVVIAKGGAHLVLALHLAVVLEELLKGVGA